MVLEWCGLVSTFCLFSACCWRLARTPHPQSSLFCRVGWALWGFLYIAVAISSAAWIMDDPNSREGAEWHLCVIRLAVSLLWVIPWQRRSGDSRC